MKININGGVKLSSSLNDYIQNRIDKEISNMFDENSNISISFVRNGRNIKVAFILKENHKRGLMLKSQVESDDAYSAFDLAFTKILRELRKHKDKMLSYRKHLGDLKAKNSDLPYIIAERNIITNLNIEEDKDNKISVIETKKTEIEELDIDEAVMKMELLELSGFVFLNKNNKNINFIYKRPDGNLSWINPIDTTIINKGISLNL